MANHFLRRLLSTGLSFGSMLLIVSLLRMSDDVLSFFVVCPRWGLSQTSMCLVFMRERAHAHTHTQSESLRCTTSSQKDNHEKLGVWTLKTVNKVMRFDSLVSFLGTCKKTAQQTETYQTRPSSEKCTANRYCIRLVRWGRVQVWWLNISHQKIVGKHCIIKIVVRLRSEEPSLERSWEARPRTMVVACLQGHRLTSLH